MPVKSIAVLKTFFETGDRPTEGQFIDLIDSFVHKNTGLVVTSYSFDDQTGDVSIGFSDGDSLDFNIMPAANQEIDYINGLQAALDGKVDTVVGKELSTNDFTNALKTKLEDLTQVVLPTEYDIAFITGLQDALDLKANDDEVVKSVNGNAPDVNGNVEIPIPTSAGMVDVNSAVDKTGLYCFGVKAGINEGNLIIGWRSTVADPASDADFDLKGFAK